MTVLTCSGTFSCTHIATVQAHQRDNAVVVFFNQV